MYRLNKLPLVLLTALTFAMCGSTPVRAQFLDYTKLFGNATSPTETTFIRQFARDKPYTYIICSGKTANRLGEVLKNTIYKHPDGRNTDPGKVKVVNFVEAEEASKSSKEWATSNYVFLLNGAEMSAPLPAALQTFLPKESKMKPTLAWSGAQRLHDLAGPGLQHTVLLSAPDLNSLARLVIRFIKRTATNNGSTEGLWKKLPFEETHTVNHIVVYSPTNIREEVQRWGSLNTINTEDPVQSQLKRLDKTLNLLADKERPDDKPGSSGDEWMYTEWRPLSKINKGDSFQTEGCNRVYFIDRSDINTKELLPKEIGDSAYDPGSTEPELSSTYPLLGSKAIKTERNDVTTVVFSAPNERMLVGIASIYPNVAAVPTEPKIVYNLDLRCITGIGLAIQGNKVGHDEREKLHDLTAASMRRDLKLDVDIRTSFYKDVPTDATVEDVLDYHCKKYGNDYICIIKIVDYEGTTEYATGQERITPKLEPLNESPPLRGGFKGKNAGTEYQDALTGYQARMAEYQRALRADYSWRRFLLEKTTARVRGQITLYRVSDTQKPVWQEEVDFPYEPDPKILKDETYIVHGADGEAPSIDHPNTRPSVPADTMARAVEGAVHQACLKLQGKARFKGAGETSTEDKSIAIHRRLPGHEYPNKNPDKTAKPVSPEPNRTIATRGDGSTLSVVNIRYGKIEVQLSVEDATKVKEGQTGKLHAGSNLSDPIVLTLKIEQIVPAPDDKSNATAICAVSGTDKASLKQDLEKTHGLVTWDAPGTTKKPDATKPKNGKK